MAEHSNPGNFELIFFLIFITDITYFQSLLDKTNLHCIFIIKTHKEIFNFF